MACLFNSRTSCVSHSLAEPGPALALNIAKWSFGRPRTRIEGTFTGRSLARLLVLHLPLEDCFSHKNRLTEHQLQGYTLVLAELPFGGTSGYGVRSLAPTGNDNARQDRCNLAAR